MTWTDKIKDLNYLLIVLCLVAGLRVWLYSAAFPFVGNVDEGAHIDLVVKYSRGEIPRKPVVYSLDYVILTSVLASCEYLVNEEQTIPLPWWKSEGWWIRGYADTAAVRKASASLNHESMQPPLYYVMAGLWVKAVDRLLSPDIGGHRRGFYLMYWMRFLNVPLVILLVWLSYQCARSLFPENKLSIYLVATLVALMPQDTFYSVQNDVLSPVCFGFVLLYGIRFLKAAQPAPGLGLAVGAATGAMVLVKLTNLPLFALSTILVVYKGFQVYRTKEPRKSIVPYLNFFVVAWTPLLLWFLWNYLNVGTFTASEEKIQALTWTYKPISEWLDSSLLTLSGIKDFWSMLMITFWRGELIFHQRSVGMTVTDAFFWISSLVFLLLALFRFVRFQLRPVEFLLTWSFWLPVIFLIFLSLVFDYGECGNPSQARPYFTSGRLISAALIPFSILYVRGYEYLFSWMSNRWLKAVLFLVILSLITLAEAVSSTPVFRSHYNFLNL